MSGGGGASSEQGSRHSLSASVWKQNKYQFPDLPTFIPPFILFFLVFFSSSLTPSIPELFQRTRGEGWWGGVWTGGFQKEIIKKK